MDTVFRISSFLMATWILAVCIILPWLILSNGDATAWSAFFMYPFVVLMYMSVRFGRQSAGEEVGLIFWPIIVIGAILTILVLTAAGIYNYTKPLLGRLLSRLTN